MRDENCNSTGDGEVSGGDAIRHLKESIANGRAWHVALLEAIGLWTRPEEDVNGHHYSYLIDGEAFDWLLLAERLSRDVADAIPPDELLTLLFFGRLPEELGAGEFKELVGEAKYHAYLNYHFGVTVEKFLLLAVEEEIRKERLACPYGSDDGSAEDGHQRLYGARQETLLWMFREEKGYRHSKSMDVDQLHEFTYWLFKYRLKNSDKARVASDTKKGMDYLGSQYLASTISGDGGSQTT
jgi:hypothetical protein